MSCRRRRRLVGVRGAAQPIRLALRGPIERTDLRGLYDRVCTLLTNNRGRAVECDVLGIDPDAIAVEALATLQLAARRHACEFRLRNASDDLLELLDLLGLTEALTGEPSRVELERQPEQRK